jgi:hypothetical protein
VLQTNQFLFENCHALLAGCTHGDSSAEGSPG